MQLLRMTMQQEQEGEGSVDHGSHQTSPDPDKASQSSSTAQRHIPDLQQQSLGDTSSFCRLLLPEGRSACHQEHGSNTLPLSGNSAGLVCSVTGHNHLLSLALCNHQLCHTASLAGNSELSPLPDVNCNTLTSRFSVADSLCSGDGEVLKPVVLEQVVSPDTDQKIETDMCAFERKLPLHFGNTANSDENDSTLLETREDRPRGNQSVMESSSWLTQPAACTGDSVDGKKHTGEYVLQVENKETLHLYPQVDNSQVCELQPGQIKVDSATSGNLKSSADACSQLSTDQQGQENEAHESDVNLRNSVDMDVEESDSDEGPSVQSGNKSFTPYIPQTAADTDLAGRDQSSTSVDVLLDKPVNSSSVETTPESIPEKRSVLSIPLSPSLQSTNLHVIPPIWTTLALHSAARYNLPQVSPNMEPPVSATANAHTQCISDSLLSEETGAIIEILNHNVSISSKMMRPDSRFKSTPFFGNHNRSIGFRSSSTTSKRSPLHGILRPKHGRMSSSALKNPDVFLEALLEDECALYAGRLQSFLKNSKADCDRQEIPDPVSKTLTEGDDMHFMPICDDSTRGCCRPAFEDSKFANCIPVWESVA